MVSSDDEVKLVVAPCGSSEVEKVSLYFGQSVLTVLRRMTGWLECGWLVCWLQTYKVKRLDVELGCGPGWSNAWWCAFCRRGCQMSLMCNPLSCGTVLCCRISMASRTRLVCQCGMDVMRLLSSQLILCCCCACFTMTDLSSSPSCWQALCSSILVLKLLPVSPM